MSDRYIDFWEVGEYGGHFVEHAQALIGASPLVDVEQVRTLVANAVAKVDSELEKSGIKRSSLRVGRDDTTNATDTARKDIRRLFMYLGSLDNTSSLDVEAIFPGNKLGDISYLKPADLKARLDEIVRALALPANSTLPQLSSWQSILTTTRDALDDALNSKGNASRVTRQSSAGLRQARDEFLNIYNGVAKPLTRGLLRSLGRDDELKLFFADLQVNEASRQASTTPADIPSTTPANIPSTTPATPSATPEIA